MKDVLVTIIQKASRTNRLEMSARDNLSILFFDTDRLNPVNGILQDKQIAQFENEFVREHWIRGRGADVEKKGAVGFEEARDFRRPRLTTIQITSAIGADGTI